MRQRFLLQGLIALILANIIGFSALAEDNKENLIKAAFVANFVKFIDWDGNKSLDKHTKIDVCVYGEGGFINTSQVFKQASSDKLFLSLVKEKNLSSVASHCHMVFITPTEADRSDEVIAALKNQQVLTIGDSVDFAASGGMVEFTSDASKIRIIVNKKAIEAGGLHVDAQLLEIASKVIDK